MNCNEAIGLVHALIDGELDAVNAREVEAHTARCAHCAAELKAHRALSEAIGMAKLRYPAPSSLRLRIDQAIPVPATPINRRSLLKGFALGSITSAAAAASVAFLVVGQGHDQRILSDAVSAHLRSLQPGRLTDVLSSDQHTVKPWFNGRIDLAPPVIDLAGQGFRLIGGRLDYIDGKPVAALVYRRRVHVINLFVSQDTTAATSIAPQETFQGFNILRWRDQGLSLLAISDLNLEELKEFRGKFQAAAT